MWGTSRTQVDSMQQLYSFIICIPQMKMTLAWLVYWWICQQLCQVVSRLLSWWAIHWRNSPLTRATSRASSRRSWWWPGSRVWQWLCCTRQSIMYAFMKPPIHIPDESVRASLWTLLSYVIRLERLVQKKKILSEWWQNFRLLPSDQTRRTKY